MRFWCDWQAFGQAREGGHPAFADPRWEPWEIQALMRFVASELNSNPGAQQAALQPESWRRRHRD